MVCWIQYLQFCYRLLASSTLASIFHNEILRSQVLGTADGPYQNNERAGRQTKPGMPARRSGDQDADTEGRGPAHQTGRPADRAQRTARVEPGPRTPPDGGNTHRAEAPATTARVRTARRARGEPENDEARSTTAEGQQERTAASTSGAQPTRTEPPADRTAETTGATGKGEPCRDPQKATAPPRGKEEGPDVSLLEIMFCLPGGGRETAGRGYQGAGNGRYGGPWKPVRRRSRLRPAGVAC